MCGWPESSPCGADRAPFGSKLWFSEVTGRGAGGRCVEAAGETQEIRATPLQEHCAIGCPSAERSI